MSKNQAAKHDWTWRGVLFGAALALLTQAGPATAQDSRPNRYVLIVANNRSLEPELRDLHYADDDGALYYQMLSRLARRAVLLTTLDAASQRRFPMLAGQTSAPTRDNVIASIHALRDAMRRDKQAGLDAEFLFVLVGHGGIDTEGKGYAHLLDARLSRADLFREVMSDSPATRTHIIIDACDAFSLVGGRGKEGGTEGEPTQTLLDSFLKGHDLETYPSVGVLVATSEDRETHEWSRIRSGVFSHLVRSAFTGAADINNDGLVEYSEAAAFIDAAWADLPDSGRRGSTFAWPPLQDRRAPLVDLNQAPSLSTA